MARTGPAGQLLIEDADGQVLETDRANLFAVTGGMIRTPPADGRLLPGVTRAAVLECASAAGLAVDLVPLTRRDLTTASEAFVTNSVRGVLPVRSVTGTELPVEREFQARDTSPQVHELVPLCRGPGYADAGSAGLGNGGWRG
jgi:branched-subunit amino acid aminotransferase/4-amino-4-deoxychorismate lyase